MKMIPSEIRDGSKIVATLDITVTVMGLSVDEVYSFDEETFPDAIGLTGYKLRLYFEDWFSKRCPGGGYEYDDIALEKLNLMYRKYLFGRMHPARFCVGLIENFQSDTDNLKLYPLKDELVSWIAQDVAFSNLYLLESHDNLLRRLTNGRDPNLLDKDKQDIDKEI